MMAEDQILKGINQLLKLDTLFIASVKKNTGLMLSLNEKQLDLGRLNTDKNISPSYSAYTRKKKDRELPDLKDTGDWRNSLYIDVKVDKLDFKATDWKDYKLIDKYSSDIKGLTQNNSVLAFNEILKPINNTIDADTKKYI